MRDILRRLFIAVMLGFFTDASAQLPPPEVMVDKYLVQAEQLFEKQDYIAARNMVEKIIALAKEHSFILPNEFQYQYAQIAFSTGSTQAAFDAVSKYLSAEQKGEFYEEALVLLIKIEKELAKFKARRSRLTNYPKCYFWNFSPEIYPPMTWFGECSGGFAQGKGTLIGDSWDDMYFAQGVHSVKKITRKEMGQFQNGKKHGHWVESYKDSTWYESPPGETWLRVSEGLYVEGKRHGYWITHLDSLIDEEGLYVDGKRHGDWVHYFSDEDVKGEYSIYNVHRWFEHWYRWYGRWSLPGYGDTHRKALEEGPYVEGKRHGRWVVRRSYGINLPTQYSSDYNHIIKQEGPYVGDKKHGDWIHYFSDGNVEAKGSYVDNKKHGDWIHYFPDGSVRIKAYWTNGERSRH